MFPGLMRMRIWSSGCVVANPSVTQKCTKFGLFMYCRLHDQSPEIAESSREADSSGIILLAEAFEFSQISKLRPKANSS